MHGISWLRWFDGFWFLQHFQPTPVLQARSGTLTVDPSTAISFHAAASHLRHSSLPPLLETNLLHPAFQHANAFPCSPPCISVIWRAYAGVQHLRSTVDLSPALAGFSGTVIAFSTATSSFSGVAGPEVGRKDAPQLRDEQYRVYLIPYRHIAILSSALKSSGWTCRASGAATSSRNSCVISSCRRTTSYECSTIMFSRESSVAADGTSPILMTSRKASLSLNFWQASSAGVGEHYTAASLLWRPFAVPRLPVDLGE